jgi:hypothetical protein
VELPTSSCHGVLYLRYYGFVGTFSSKPLGGSRGVVLLSPRVWKGCQWLGTRDWYLMHYSNPSVTRGQKHTHIHSNTHICQTVTIGGYHLRDGQRLSILLTRARECSGSSYSGLHFGHYKGASFCTNLSALHASKLSLVACKGVPLSRRNCSLTVLLEKIVGNVFAHKLRAICLLKIDFNLWNKPIFAQRMMQQAINEGSIPQECFAKKNSHCNYAVLTEQFFCDSSRTRHHPVGLGECDFGDCYDHAAHPPTSIALCSWGIPVMGIRVLLTSMKVQLIWSWGGRAMAVAREVPRHGRAHPYSWSVTIDSLSGLENDEMNHRSEWEPNS